eukprot:6003231-Prymnesium_polylepis.1
MPLSQTKHGTNRQPGLARLVLEDLKARLRDQAALKAPPPSTVTCDVRPVSAMAGSGSDKEPRSL